ncbi:hypothetical protein NM688_g6852 [Phlebia brevispora]|uniref:Uncharacterized protein n=1 Tax=Phlebia brevispora TaxID=194682 RepID=A0ACC1SBN9_9APHY|nr:hypothetical protein NM688_g6852 [Phlebia brevispora]
MSVQRVFPELVFNSEPANTRLPMYGIDMVSMRADRILRRNTTHFDCTKRTQKSASSNIAGTMATADPQHAMFSDRRLSDSLDTPGELGTAFAVNSTVKPNRIARESSDDTVVSESEIGENTRANGVTGFGNDWASGAVTALPAIIPPTHSARTLVLCFDESIFLEQPVWQNSNVVQFFSMLKKDDRRQQMVYYQAGIGTYLTPQVATPFTAKLSKTLDEMIAWNLDAHVMDGYEFLMQNYEAGDKICIFGFSRGAYTARALAGMIHKVGLLPACNHQQVPFAYNMFSRTDEIGWAQSTVFKKAFSMDVDIEFIGVWDTVASVGLFPRRLPFTTSNTAVKTFRHAVSLDERRAKFKANLFNRPTEAEVELGVRAGEMPKSVHPTIQSNTLPVRVVYDGDDDDDDDDNGDGIKKGEGSRRWQREMEKRFSKLDGNLLETDVLEVWFAGCHCDVGGGSVPNDTPHTLARIPLRWMIRQCFLTNTGIQFHTELLRNVGIDPATLYPIVKERPPALSPPPPLPPQDPWLPRVFSGFKWLDPQSDSSGGAKPKNEEEEDLTDALCPIYDQLSLNKGWWILELLPIRHKVQQSDNSWANEITMNLGQGRSVPYGHHREGPFYVHRTVKTRMEAQGLPDGPYRFKAQHLIEPTMATLEGKRIVIIGGSSGIGYSIAKASLLSLAEHVLIASSSSAKVDAAVSRLQAEPGLQKLHSDRQSRIAGGVCDLGDAASVRTFSEGLGEIDHLVITGGDSSPPFAFHDADLEAHRNVFDIRFWGPAIAAQQVKIRSGGSITFTTGIGILRPSPMRSLLIGTGGAVDALTRALAVELAPVRVNSVAPGIVITDRWKDVPKDVGDKMLGEALRRLPVKHLGTPEEVAEAYLFLMKCNYITGQRIEVDGGDRLV